MELLRKIIFYIAIVFLILWVVFPLIRMIAHIEFADENDRASYRYFLIYAVPTAILLTLVRLVKRTHTFRQISSRVIPIVIIAAGAFIFLRWCYIFDGMCGWTINKTLFIHKNDPNTTIIYRDFDCGATDGDDPSPEFHKAQPFLTYFKRYEQVDTSKIDKRIWLEVDSSPF